MQTQHKALWTVGLSNGENYYEEKGNYKTIPGELSPWQRLKKYLSENAITITSLSIYTDDGRRFNLPSAGKNPKFHALSVAPQPVSYCMFRKMGGDLMNGKIMDPEIYIVIEAIYADGNKLQTWVCNKTFNAWSVIV